MCTSLKTLHRSLVTLVWPLILLMGALSANASERLNFDAGWKFHLGDSVPAQTADFDDSAWRALDVPHDWSIEAERSTEYSGRNSFLPGGIAWYRKQFELPASAKGQHVEIQFDGVYRHSEVWVNGQSLGIQYDGYTSFRYDLTPHLRWGEPNTIAVRVDNSKQPNCRWYSGSGIYRHVWLRVTAPLHIATWGTAITTPTVTAEQAEVVIATAVDNTATSDAHYVLETVLFDRHGNEVARAESDMQLGAKQQQSVHQTFTVDTPMRWSTETPDLYSAISRVKLGDAVADTYSSTFGIRDIQFDAQQGFSLNGQSMKLKGVCLHHEAGVLGAVVPDAVWERRLNNLRAIGCNAIRTAHNPVAPEFLDLCDRLGFLVMNEFVDKWEHKVVHGADPLNDPAFADPYFETEWQKNFGTTIRRDRNHPSVIIWSVGNENNHPGDEEENRRMKLYRDFVRSIDTTRPVISGMERGKDKPVDEKVDDILETTAFMDLIALNYGEQWVERIAHRNPGKPYVSTESYTYFNSTENKRFSFVERSPWLDVIENDSNIGLFLWVGIDYLGEIVSNKHFKWPAIGIECGLLDYAGFRKDSAYLYESFWTEEPMVYLSVYTGDPDDFSATSHWYWPKMQSTWNLPESRDVDIACYSNCDFVELYLNGRKLGTQRMADFPNHIMKWRQIPYEAGTLRAVGLRDGKAVSEFELTTTGPIEHLELQADSTTLKPGAVTHLEITAVDAAGNRVTDQNVALNFSISGNGSILGLDNGCADTNHRAKDTQACPTYKGRCLAIVQAGDTKESFKLTVSAPGVPQQTIQFHVTP